MTEYNQEIYKNFEANESLSIPSYMGIVSTDISLHLTEGYLYGVLTANPEFIVESLVYKNYDGLQAYEIAIRYNGNVMRGLVSMRLLSEIDLQNYSFANGIGKYEFDQAQLQTYYFDTSVLFSRSVFDSYLFQLKLLNTIVPEAYLGIDFSTTSVFSVSWMKMIVEANVPPEPSYLYSIKVSYNGENKDKTYWYRTEGLLRCGCPELELINIKQGEREMHDLLAVAAHLQIECRHKERYKFQVGYDGMGLYLSWVRWENALADFSPNIPGGLAFRQGEDNFLARPSGILYAVEDNNLLVSPEVYVPIIRKQPIFMITSAESARKKALAVNRWNVFVKAFSQLPRKSESKKESFWSKLFKIRSVYKKDALCWVFLVKLGFDTHNEKIGYRREHLWFEVLNIENGQLTGKLCNKPYGIKDLEVGDIKTYTIQEYFSDWKIYDPSDYEFTPDSAYILEDELHKN